MNWTRRFAPLLGLAVALLLSPAYAQKTTGTISGAVTDPSGAAIPNAQVTATDPNTGQSRSTTTNNQGEYTLEDLPVGTYQVEIQAANFKQSITKNVELHVASTSIVNTKLQMGAVSEQVTVQASDIQVQTESAELGEVVDGTQVKELPLNGRSFVQLTQLQPGVSPANNFDSKNKGLLSGVDFSVNGNPTTNNLFLVDGANDNDVGSNRTILIYPSIESIAEFKMLTNSFGPEYGQASGAVITIVTRSGTNAFHGSAFYDGRNDALAAYSYFAARNAGKGLPLNGKDKLRRNDWGYSIGGPIKRDKLFFFFNEEWNHEVRGYTESACVPTAAERAGDFSSPVVAATATTGAQMSCNEPQPTFANGSHVLATVDPAGALLPQKYPLPNLPLNPGGNNWSQSLPTFVKYRQENVRGDYTLNKSNTLMGRYTQDHFDNPSFNGDQYWGDDPFPALNSNWSQPSKMIIGRWTSTISSTLVNDAEFAYSNNRINITPGGTDPGLLAQETAAFPTLYPNSLKHAKQGIPQIWGGLGNYGSNNNYQTIAPWNNTLDIYTVRDDITKSLGRHNLRFGAFLGFDGKNEDTNTSSSERLTFSTADYQVCTAASAPTNPACTGYRTGNNLANVLIPGNPFTLTEVSTNVRAQLRWRDYEFYAADSFKLKPTVTLDLGVRYSLLRNPFQPNDQITSFQPQLYDPTKPASDACNGLWVAPGKDPCGAANKEFGTNFSSGTTGPNRALVRNNNHMFAPRIGIAWDVHGDGRTALRAGVGQFYQRERVSRYTLVANAPFAVTTNNYARGLNGATPPSLAGGGASPSGGMEPAAILPNSWQWNLTWQQQLAKNTVFQLSYVGNRGIHLTSSYDINAIPQSSWLQASFLTGSAQQALRPFANDGTLTYWSHQGDSNYHALQSVFKTQVKQFRLGAAYTWSHSISDIQTDDSSGGLGAQSFTIANDPRADRGNSPTNRPNIFVANGGYFFPKMVGSNGITRGVLGGWELTGITTAASGNSFTVYQNSISENTANVITGATGGGSLNSLIGTGYTNMQRPLVAPGQSCRQGIRGDQVINPNVFTLIGYHLGTLDPLTEPRGYCQGPRLVDTDGSIDKNWTLHDRVTIQFRFDAFDLLNHANFRADQIHATIAGNVNCGVAVGGKYAPCSPTNNVVTAQTLGQSFGQAYGVVGNAGRQFQYGLHINF